MAMPGMWWLLCLVCFIVLWGLWYVAVLRPASSSTRRHGPRWLTRCLVGCCSHIGENLCGVSFDHDGERFEIDSSDSDWEEEGRQPNQQVVMGWHPHGAYALSAMLFGGEVFLNCGTSSNTWSQRVLVPGQCSLCTTRSHRQITGCWLQHCFGTWGHS